MNGEAELEALARQMYEQTAELLGDPFCGPVATEKITALYGPPILRPNLALVSFQGGGGDPSSTLDSWPDRLLYLDDDYVFGRALRKHFREAGLYETLATSTVAMAACFPEAPASESQKWMARSGPRAKWREFSSAWVKRLVQAMQPHAVLVFGSKASTSLGMDDSWTRTEHAPGRGMVFGVGHFEGAPAVFCHHLSQGAANTEVQRCLSTAKALTSGKRSRQVHA